MPDQSHLDPVGCACTTIVDRALPSTSQRALHIKGVRQVACDKAISRMLTRVKGTARRATHWAARWSVSG